MSICAKNKVTPLLRCGVITNKPINSLVFSMEIFVLVFFIVVFSMVKYLVIGMGEVFNGDSVKKSWNCSVSLLKVPYKKIVKKVVSPYVRLFRIFFGAIYCSQVHNVLALLVQPYRRATQITAITKLWRCLIHSF